MSLSVSVPLFLLFVLSYSYLFVLGFHYILFYYYPLAACFLTRQKEGGSGWEGKCGGSRRSKGNQNQSILYEKVSFLTKIKESF